MTQSLMEDYLNIITSEEHQSYNLGIISLCKFLNYSINCHRIGHVEPLGAALQQHLEGYNIPIPAII